MNLTRTEASNAAGEHRALVVGASGGIGAALSAALAARGAVVTTLSRSTDGFDITDPAKVRFHMERLRGPFQSVIVASGILVPDGGRPEKSLDDIDADSMAQVLAVNAIGPALVLRHLPRLLPRNERSVTGILTARVGSIGDNRLGGWYSYRAAKAAANQIVHTAAIEIARKRKQAIVAALHPGTVETPFTKNYPQHAKSAPGEAAASLLSVLDGLTPADSGGFFDWAGKPVPW
ncbi:SDR family NAD(P)-dependent oxidoreductase [Leisingera sp. ANG59]|uniref:SDR family NAD(P)-dependent oxidoreductase n=1 Tax=Leisingera sp. ANG59 TaxID=2675221 RepID=UPI001573B9B0|nr:SDR family NAD(P)-dependent oxidoreductase [Leisingera sp. ANG59]NSY41134.1 SDR family NAD(P)-dependent oxidoreductase [Leisingera sp. ANG59]